jgi:hypothetical protein
MGAGVVGWGRGAFSTNYRTHVSLRDARTNVSGRPVG